MTAGSLIRVLQEHDPAAEVHVVNDRGYYQVVLDVRCAADLTFPPDDQSDPPGCDGSCRRGRPVVLAVD